MVKAGWILASGQSGTQEACTLTLIGEHEARCSDNARTPLMTEPGASRAVNAMNTIRARPVPHGRLTARRTRKLPPRGLQLCNWRGGPCLAGEGFLAPNQKRAGHHRQLRRASAAAFAYASNCLPCQRNRTFPAESFPPPWETATTFAEHLDKLSEVIAVSYMLFSCN